MTRKYFNRLILIRASRVWAWLCVYIRIIAFRPARLLCSCSGDAKRIVEASKIAEEPLEERLRRVAAIEVEEPGSEIEKAVLRGTECAQVMLSGLVAHVEALADTKHDNRYKNEEQIKRWRQGYERAVRNLRAALKAAGEVDDKP